MRTWLLASVLVFCAASPLVAQGDQVSQALRLRDSGDFQAAARLLQTLWTSRPGDEEVARLLAQTLYWAQDVPGARRVYDAALARYPRNDRVRLDYARMLAETGDRTRARELLAQIGDSSERRADALTLLGTLAYWEGDWTSARRLFAAALQLDPAQAEAGRQARELRLSTLPWIQISPALWHDDQPLDRRSIAVEAGWFVTPLTSLRGRISPASHTSERQAITTIAAEVELRHAAPRARVEIELAAGGLRRSDGGVATDEWTGRGIAGLRVAPHVRLRGRLERAPYFHTTASLATPIRTDVAAAELHVDDPRGWLAQAAVQQHRYPDGNTTGTAYAWLLAPILSVTGGTLQGGYAFAAENSRESRFVPVRQSPGPGNPQTGIEGRYEPYYTPAHVVRHSAIGAATARIAPRVTLRLGGGYGFRAREEAPHLIDSDGQLQRVFVPRTFSPWELRGSLEVGRADGVTVGVHAEAGRLAFYRWSTATLRVTYRFTDPRDRGPSEAR